VVGGTGITYKKGKREASAEPERCLEAVKKKKREVAMSRPFRGQEKERKKKGTSASTPDEITHTERERTARSYFYSIERQKKEREHPPARP